MTTHLVNAHREGDWWALSIDVEHREIWTQCKRLDQAEEVAREALTMAGVRTRGVDLDLRVELDPETNSIVEATLSASLAAAEAQAVACREGGVGGGRAREPPRRTPGTARVARWGRPTKE